MTIADAESENQPEEESGSAAMPSIPPLVIGEPFAIAEGVELLRRVGMDEAAVRKALAEGVAGCAIVVKCDGPEGQACEQIFRIDLLQPGVKNCPKCKTQYSHMLLVAPVDDEEIIAAAMATVLDANGLELPPGPGDEDDDEEGDEEEDDDEDDEAR